MRPFPLKRILASCDLSAAGVNAAWRAVLLARQHGAWVRLLCVCRWRSQLAPAQARLDVIVNELQRHTQVAILGQAVVGLPHQELSEAAADADLTVLRAPDAHPLTEWLLGAHPGRVLRHCQSPVLVVRQPASVGYRRVLAAIAFDGGGAGVIAVACGMMGGPVREVLNALVVQPDLVRPGGGRDGILAARRLRAVVQQVMIDNDGARRVFGAPSIVLNHSPEMLLKKERAVFAELLVLARPRPGDGDRDGWFPQGDAQRLLAATASDVLLLPAGPLVTSGTTP